jgi:type I restriction enzyme S subunit
VAKLEELKPLVESYGRYQTRLSELNASIGPLLKKSILQAAIQGKLVPQDSNDASSQIILPKVVHFLIAIKSAWLSKTVGYARC